MTGIRAGHVRIGGENLTNRQPRPPFLEREMTAAEFFARTGASPVNDDLDRVNCEQAGMPGHHSCGLCVHGHPKFLYCHQCGARQGLHVVEIHLINALAKLGEVAGLEDSAGIGRLSALIAEAKELARAEATRLKG